MQIAEMVRSNKGTVGPKLLGALLTFTALLPGCTSEAGDAALYSHFERVEGAAWSDTVEYFFSFPVKDTLRAFSVTGIIRHTPAYNLKSLPLGIVCENADVARPKYETRSLLLPSPPGGGHLRDREGYYVIRELSFPIDERVTFPRAGIYTYSFRQLADLDSIPGIAQVGLVVKPL